MRVKSTINSRADAGILTNRQISIYHNNCILKTTHVYSLLPTNFEMLHCFTTFDIYYILSLILYIVFV